MTAMTPSPELQLPWESSGEEDRRFHRIVRGMLAALLAVAITVPLLPVEAPERDQRAPQPPQLARILLEKQALPTPTPAPPRPQPKPEPKPVEAVTRPRPTPPEPAAKPLPTPQDTLVQAREAAQAAGVLAFRDELSELRDSLDLDAMPRTVTSRGEASAATVERAVITSAAVSNSGGINTAALSRDSGGPALSGRETTRVRSNIAGTDKQPASSQSAQLGGRSDESIRQVMDRNKGALFAIYNRALRQDPLLQGKLVFEMLIDASGEIARIRLLSSELSDRDLTDKILARIRMIRFEAQDVLTTRVNYSFDFLPYS
ncbi:MAG: AgmX/PglI C-terminal domain-containing protein [Pseudomonadales bacterium]|nr:AgmX/PglI C-terminal domain-containing protein [Halioglobus sp.]MCP5121790.1 AgmX/PglI C-terminal domain-containing protein [Pseudomonadales bacterium]MCP5192671.1 AgmX/PglI C-terminal domain-containing protein [Pseudomonadales bacterium]